jgi:hypothetical protein
VTTPMSLMLVCGMGLPPLLQLWTMAPALRPIRQRWPHPRRANTISSLLLFGTLKSCVTDETVRPPVVDVGVSRHAIVGCRL